MLAHDIRRYRDVISPLIRVKSMKSRKEILKRKNLDVQKRDAFDMRYNRHMSLTAIAA